MNYQILIETILTIKYNNISFKEMINLNFINYPKKCRFIAKTVFLIITYIIN